MLPQITGPDAFSIRELAHQGESLSDLAVMFNTDLATVRRVLDGELLWRAGGPLAKKGPLHPDNHEGSARQFAQAVLVAMEEQLDPEAFFLFYSLQGLTAAEVQQFKGD